MSAEYTGERFLPKDCKGEMEIEHYQRYRFAGKFVKGKKVLDAACGEGYGSHILSAEAKEVTGLDISTKTVENANKKYGKDNLSFRAGSVEKLPFEDNSFDVVISYETIEHVTGEVQESFLKEIRRVLKPDGFLIMSTPNKAVYTDLVKGENAFHVKEFYVDEYDEFLGKYFKNRTVYCQYPEVGYFLAPAGEKKTYVKNTYNKEEKHPKESRYVITLCSDTDRDFEVETEELTVFDDSMYYDLNRIAHEKEREILSLKAEAEAYAEQLEESIRAQQEYIKKLEHNLDVLKEKRNPLRKLLKRR